MSSLAGRLALSSAALARFRAVKVAEFRSPPFAWPELAAEHERLVSPGDLEG